MMNPKTLNLSELPWLPLEEKSAFPTQPAIYFCIDSNDVVQYIGRATNLNQRWGNHHRYNQLTDIGDIKIAWLETSEDYLSEVEANLINYFNPALNNSEMLTSLKCNVIAKLIRNRMNSLGIDIAALNRLFCEIRRSRGDSKAKPINRRNMLLKAISEDSNPTISTFVDMVHSLGGRVLIEWKE